MAGKRLMTAQNATIKRTAWRQLTTGIVQCTIQIYRPDGSDNKISNMYPEFQ